MPSSKLSSLLVSLAPLAAAASLAACSFGDDRQNGEPLGPDAAPKPDAMPIDAPPGFDAPTEPKVFEMTLNPPTPIPDNNTAGVTIMIPVSGVTYTTQLDVSVNITHTFRGDLRIQLLRGSNLITTLKDKSTDSANDVVETYPVAVTQLGTPYNGAYNIRVIDTANLDTGSINSIKLTFKVD